MLKRTYNDLSKFIKQDKVLIIYGARRIGKTTLLKEFLKTYTAKYNFVSGDDIHIHEILSSSDIKKIKEFCDGYSLLIIDEAQNIKNVGHGLKIITDHVPNLQVIATGSSAFDLANKIGEPLVGRKIVLTMFPLAQCELSLDFNKYELRQNLENYLIFGSYPEVLTMNKKEDKITYLREITGSYLYKDILSFFNLKNPQILQKLTKLLAFQIGQEVSVNELATKLGVDVKTVARYLDLLEKSFIIFRLSGYGKNLRTEISKKNKYYFVDNGIRNAVISQFNSIEDRADIGQLFENFLISERIKKNTYSFSYSNSYFWRTYDQNEVDYIEEKDDVINGFEFKWNADAKVKANPFLKKYPNASLKVINQENYLEFVV
jgi:predicted AAA+ superfamily ATPase